MTPFLLTVARSPSLAPRLLALVIAVLLASCGCSQKAAPVRPLAAPALVVPDGSVRAVQRTPEYRQAIRCFARRDYRQALSLVDRLLAGPQFPPASAGFSFLMAQQAICRHALNLQANSRDPLGSGPNAPASGRGPQAYPALPPVLKPSPSPAVSAARVAAAPAAASADCGPRAMLLACQTLGRPATLEDLRRQAGTTSSGTSLQGLAQAAQAHGLKARGVQMDLPALEQLSQPAIVWMDGNHYVALLSVKGDGATIHDPNQPNEEVLPVNTLLQRSGGVLLTLSR